MANIVAALIVAGAILWNGSAFNKRADASSALSAPAASEEEAYAKWYARAVGDIRNDIVVNCGCCGEGDKKPGF